MRHFLSLVLPSMLLTAIACPLNATKRTAVTSGPTAKTRPWLRLQGEINQVKVSNDGQNIAFTNADGTDLQVLQLSSKNVHLVTHHHTNLSFFWAPDNTRLFYREHFKAKDSGVSSRVQAYDTYLNKSVLVAEYPHQTGFLTFDPKLLKMYLLHSKGIHAQRIFFPDERLARWQIAQRDDQGNWIASQKGILHVKEGGFVMSRLPDDGSELQAFAISPDGEAVAWATSLGNVYACASGKSPIHLGQGMDPSWHPTHRKLIFAAPRFVGQKIVDTDLKISDLNGSSQFITFSQGSKERWPVWTNQGQQILYTYENSTDLHKINFNPNGILRMSKQEVNSSLNK